MIRKLFIVSICILLVLGITGCAENVEEKSIEKESIEYEYTDEGIIKPEIAKKVIEDISNNVIKALDDKDMDTLSSFVHPIKGIRFTPYTYVSLDNDIVFSKDETKNFFENQNEYIWGVYDGKGDEIKLTPSDYFEKFVYSENFIDPEEIGYNTVLSSGNMLKNQFEVYENPIVVEYYFSGFNPEFQGIDWKSLRLVFEEYEGQWFLVGIIHNQWTI